ncbi:hypothetical protein B0H17DRAFT_67344 [Mycena rosella]|uniref:Glycan binding protein Y3-like domain-containing protein n=1 Tax=Mycena rosella TaxID=1033263 RepID=A0AAD7E124_MYCRO|nr:hypothetical protein B0H17DRAFT_67344 [Mycena rosella]
MLSNILGLVLLALIVKPSYAQVIVNCNPSSPQNAPDCRPFIAGFCEAKGAETVLPGNGIDGCAWNGNRTDFACLMYATNEARIPQIPTVEICLEVLTAIGNECHNGNAHVAGDSFIYVWGSQVGGCD